MRIIFNAPDLTSPTYQTLVEYSNKRFKKLKKHLSFRKKTEKQVRVGVEKIGDMFEMVVEIFSPSHLVVRLKDRDLRKLIDKSSDQLARRIKNTKEKIADIRARERRKNSALLDSEGLLA